MYSAITRRIGLKPNEDEYITMGMAAFGQPTYDLEPLLWQNNHRGVGNVWKDAWKVDLAASVQSLYEKKLLELNIELNEQIKAIKSNLDSTENDKYNNISFSEEQLEEAIVRLILFYSELKIQDLINQIDLSKDTSLFPEVEELKKNMEYYQNTL